MSVQETGEATLHPEQLVAENVSEAVWLRLRRLTSPTLCERVIAARARRHHRKEGTGARIRDQERARLLAK